MMFISAGGHFTELFNCAYHPRVKLRSLHVDALAFNLKFNGEISKMINHNCELLDLHVLGVTVSKSNTLLLETFQRCHALVTLTIGNIIDGSLGSARLHVCST